MIHITLLSTPRYINDEAISFYAGGDFLTIYALYSDRHLSDLGSLGNMKKNIFSKSRPILMKAILSLYLLFPLVLSLYVQGLHIVDEVSFLRFGLLSVLAVLVSAPVFFVFFNKNIRPQVAEMQPYLIYWILGLGFVIRMIMGQLLSTNFVVDFEDFYLAALDIYAGDPLVNLHQYAFIPSVIHLNMPAITLAQAFKILGPGAKSAKLFFVLVDTLTVYLIYQVGKASRYEKGGILGAFLYAVLPSVLAYLGTLAPDYLALPLTLLVVLTGFWIEKVSENNLYTFLGFLVQGILIGLVDWYRPWGMVLLVAVLLVKLFKVDTLKRFITTFLLSLVLFFSYSQTTQLAKTISERTFETSIRSASQRVAGYFFVGLNPDSHGQLLYEDAKIIVSTYEEFGDDIAGSQKHLIELTLARLDVRKFTVLLTEKFTLIWSHHDALFDYGLLGSNDDDFVNWTRSFEGVLWLAVTFFLIYNAYVSIRLAVPDGLFMMQLFILGFGILLLFLEVQNRYVAIIIPYSVLLAGIGAEQFFSALSQKRTQRQ